MPGLGPHDGWLLRVFGAHVDQGLGHVPYHVGSSLDASLTGEKGGRFRDVDVRLILPDDEYAAVFNDPMEKSHDAPKLMMWNFAWSCMGKTLTRLPIDFQIQQQTLANDEFKGSPRSALLILSSELPTVRNA